MTAVSLLVAVVLSQKVTSGASLAPDGAWMAYASAQDRALFIKGADGGVQRYPRTEFVNSLAFSEDGRNLVFISSATPMAPGDLWVLDLSTQKSRRVDLGTGKVRRCFTAEKAPLWIGCELVQNERVNAARVPLQGGAPAFWKAPFRAGSASESQWLFDSEAFPRVAAGPSSQLDAGMELTAFSGSRRNSLLRLDGSEELFPLGVSADGTTVFYVTSFMGAGKRLVSKATRSGVTRVLVDSPDGGSFSYFTQPRVTDFRNEARVTVAWNGARRLPEICREAVDGGEFASCSERTTFLSQHPWAVLVDRNRTDTQWLAIGTEHCDSAVCATRYFWWDRSNRRMLSPEPNGRGGAAYEER